MAYSETLAQRVRETLGSDPAISEKKMFGGLSFLHRGNMCCGIIGDELMVRVGPEQYEDALARPHARKMDFTGRPMKGMVYVGEAGIETEGALEDWVQHGMNFASSLPAK